MAIADIHGGVVEALSSQQDPSQWTPHSYLLAWWWLVIQLWWHVLLNQEHPHHFFFFFPENCLLNPSSGCPRVLMLEANSQQLIIFNFCNSDLASDNYFMDLPWIHTHTCFLCTGYHTKCFKHTVPVCVCVWLFSIMASVKWALKSVVVSPESTNLCHSVALWVFERWCLKIHVLFIDSATLSWVVFSPPWCPRC